MRGRASQRDKSGRERASQRDRSGVPENYRVGRRLSDPRMLLAIAVSWLAVGIIMLVALHASWKLVPAIFSIGVGMLYLRGALGAVIRRERLRRSS